MNKRAVLGIITLFFNLAVLHSAEWFIAPTGTKDNTGTIESPWDLTSALSAEHPVKPGDRIWIRGAIYKQPWKPGGNGLGFQVKLSGDKDNPVIISAVVNERVTIDGIQVVDPAQYLWIKNIEIAGDTPEERRQTSQSGSAPNDLPGPLGGLTVNAGTGCKYINLVIHDNMGCGVGFWKPAIDCELYGCIIYNNGWRGPDRMHGHCIYTQNENGTKNISNCILSTPYGDGQQTLQAYGSKRAYVDNYLIENNIAFSKGRFLVGGGRPSNGIRVLNNYLYKVPMQLGYNAPENEDCTVTGNIIFREGFCINKFKKVTNENNSVIQKDTDLPDEPAKIIWLPNKYDPERANLVIFNWKNDMKVSFPVRPFMSKGDHFELKCPTDIYGPAIYSGTVTDETISIPIEDEFAVFVVFKQR